MERRPLGKSDLETAPLVFGGNVFGWTINEATSFQLLDAFVDAGFNMVDTADVYSRWVPGNVGGESETILGRWLKRGTGNREKVLIATKVGMDMGGEDKGLSMPYIVRAVERSLQRLQTDHIDLYQSHQDDLETPLGETLAAYESLLKAGKVRAIGASNYTAARLKESLEVSAENDLPAYVCLQPHYNLCERPAFEPELQPLCLEAGLGVIPYFSLASGFLTGKYRTEADLAKHARGERVRKYLNPRGLRILAELDRLAAQYNSTPARVALAWLIAQPAVTAPIVSATNLDQFKDLVEATILTLDPFDVEALNQASA